MNDEAVLTVCFTPVDAVNPYQRALANELHRLGVRVQLRPSLRGLLRRACRRIGRPDIVHLHWLPSVELRVGPLLRLVLFLLRVRLLRTLGCRFVWTVHNLRHHEARYPAAERWLARHVARTASQIIVHSRAAARLVREDCRLSEDGRLRVIPHGTYVGIYENVMSSREARARLRLDDDTIVLLFFGNIRPYKGVSNLITAYQQICPERSTLLIAGKAHDSVRWALQGAVANSATIRVVTGLVRDHEVQIYMNASDVVVFPYRDVLTSGAIVLAMSFGRACIAPALGPIAELLDGRGAFLYDQKAPDGLRSAISRAIEDRERLREMGAHNLRQTADWGWDRVARETATVYSTALGRPAEWSRERTPAGASAIREQQ